MSSNIFAQGYQNAVAVTPNDTTVLDMAAFMIGGTAGTVVFQTVLGTNVTITSGLAGVVYPIAAVRIMAASTATGILALS